MYVQKKYKIRIIFLISGILMLYANLYGQQRPEHRPPLLPDSVHIVKMVDEMAKALTLTRGQKEQVAELHFSHFKQAKEMMKKNKESREAERRVMDSLRKEFEEQLKALMNDKQKTDFEKFMKKPRPRPNQQRPGSSEKRRK